MLSLAPVKDYLFGTFDGLLLTANEVVGRLMFSVMCVCVTVHKGVPCVNNRIGIIWFGNQHSRFQTIVITCLL